jgi:spermidine synthase
VLGDGRLTLAREPDGAYDCLVLDAFSSDSVPVHLLTQEAVELYARKLRPGGVLLFHLSNRHLDLAPFAAAAAEGAGMACVEWQDERTSEQVAETGRQASRWMVASADPAMLEPFARDVRWVVPRVASRPWTDARADIVAALRSDPHAGPARPRDGR